MTLGLRRPEFGTGLPGRYSGSAAPTDPENGNASERGRSPGQDSGCGSGGSPSPCGPSQGTGPQPDGGDEASVASAPEVAGSATVLIADDEELLADAYARWLDDTHATRVAYDGDEALGMIDETVDVAILDRRMPGRSGDEVASAVRDRGVDCGVAMLSANEPGLDVLDVGYDEYVVKPVTDPTELQDLIDTLRRRTSYDPDTRRLLALASKKADVEAHVSAAEREDSNAYAELLDELAALRETVGDACEYVGEEFDVSF